MQEYLGLFLDESRENLQSLNASILDLERRPDDPSEALNTIFRVAHSLKGMSATMGFDRMAGLTHRMEEVLSALRDGAAPITVDVTDVLFACLDTLEGMVNDIGDGGDGAADTAALLARLDAILKGGADAPPAPAAAGAEVAVTAEAPPAPPATPGEGDAPAALSQYEAMVVGEAAERGMTVHEIRVRLDEACMLRAARAYMVVQEVEGLGELIKSEPSTEDLEREAFEHAFTLWVATDHPSEELHARVAAVSEVAACEIVALSAEAPVDVARSASTEPVPAAPAPAASAPSEPRPAPPAEAGTTEAAGASAPAASVVPASAGGAG
ncbi:MAG TPA: Hpt domain-containing protein, partial [Miltoncostaeaceae bacterium]|nr:Hpt domain-containing protein [Miltoncostaeaceae bacterium]